MFPQVIPQAHWPHEPFVRPRSIASAAQPEDFFHHQHEEGLTL